MLQAMRSTGAKYLIWVAGVAIPFVFIFLFYQTFGTVDPWPGHGDHGGRKSEWP